MQRLVLENRLVGVGAAANGVGAGDAVAQTRSISYAKEELSQIMISAREEEKKRTRMYMGLSVIAAAIIAIAAL